MTPERRLNAIALSMMVVVVFTGVGALAPLIREADTWKQAVTLVVAMLASAGTYRVLASILAGLLRRFRFAKKLLLGPHYLEGTWVGHFIGHAGDVRYVVETFEQELDSLVIRGYSFAEDGRQHGQWTSEAAYLDVHRARLTYTYTCDILSRGVPHQGLGVFDLQRASASEPAYAIHGYVADIVDGKRLPVKETKVATYSMSPENGLEEARKVKVHIPERSNNALHQTVASAPAGER